MENSIMTSVALSLLLGIATTASAESTLLADNVSAEGNSEHIHTWNKGRIIKEATCTSEGSIKYICLDNDCDASRTEVIAALGHDFNLEFITDLTPTCEQAGSKSKHCTRCAAKSEITEIPAKGHTWSQGETLQAATCSQNGVMSHHCESYQCDATKSSVIPALGHEWDEGSLTASANCTQKGSIKYSCLHKACNTTKIEYTQPLGHDFAEKFTVDLAATCTESGRKSQHCSRCEERINTTILPAIGHAWTPSSTIEPANCTQEGLSVMRCKHIGCGETITQTTAALGHNFTAEYVVDKAATCSHEGIQSRHCSRCDIHGEEIAIPTLTHIAGDTIVEHMITACCHNEGSYDEAVYCTACKGEMYRKSFIIPVKEHTWDEGQFTIYPTTSNKGKKVYTCVECKITRHEIVEKLHEDIRLYKDNKGESFRVPKDSFYSGSEAFISYAVAQGSPIEYRLSFSAEASEVGFLDEDWKEISPDCRIAILTPENCPAGEYTAHVTFKDEIGKETNPIGFTFRVTSKNSTIDEEETPHKTNETAVYPNPIRDQVTVTFSNNSQERHFVTIINETGSTLFNASFTGDETSIECGNYTPGRYIIKVDGTTFKVIKM